MKFRPNRGKWLVIAALSLGVAGFAATGAKADDNGTTATPDHWGHSAPEPGWYVMMAAGALIPAGFYFRRKRAEANA
jgi:hypothetical protein